ncbi:hypothetical protein Q7P37_008907 [Cladosporium fusiforme]
MATIQRINRGALVSGNTSAPHHHRQLNSAIPIPTMVAKSLTPYPGPDRLTSLPTELLTNDSANSKTFFNFVKSCLHTLTIEGTTVGLKQKFHNLQIQWADASTRQVMFTLPSMSFRKIGGYRGDSRANTASSRHIQAVLDKVPNVTDITLRPGLTDSMIGPKAGTLCLTSLNALADNRGMLLALRRAKNIPESSLRLTLRRVEFTEGSEVLDLLAMIRDELKLTRLVFDSIHERGSNGVDHVEEISHCEKCRAIQQFVITIDIVSMIGVTGVVEGCKAIIEKSYF